MENVLKKLTKQEEQYSVELKEVVRQYSDLKEQADSMNIDELMSARLSVRTEKERSAVSRIKSIYGEKYEFFAFYDSKQYIADLLDEDHELDSYQKRLWQKEHPGKPHRMKCRKKIEPER